MNGEETALFRYALIRPLAEKEITKEEHRSRLSAVLSCTHEFPDGTYRKVSSSTILRWKKQYLEKGFEGLFPRELGCGVPYALPTRTSLILQKSSSVSSP